jgi:hypothetical protein
MISSKYIAAQKILTFYIEKLEDDDTEESKWALQYINLQMAKHKCNSILNMLYSYPLETEDI